MKKIITLISLYLLFCSQPLLAKVYKCSVDGKMTYSNIPCKSASSEKNYRFAKPGHSRMSSAQIEQYLSKSTSGATETYKRFYDIFDCKSFNKGMSIFPHRDVVSAVANRSFKEPVSPVHQLRRHSNGYSYSTSSYDKPPKQNGPKCYINLNRNRVGKLNFGIYSFATKDVTQWSVKKIAAQLNRQGYTLKRKKNDFRSEIKYEWSDRNVNCEIELDFVENRGPYDQLSISVECKLKRK